MSGTVPPPEPQAAPGAAEVAPPAPAPAPAPAAAPAPVVRKADTFLVACIDPRVIDETEFYMAAIGRTDRYSEFRIAGAALAAVDETRPAWMSTLFDNLASSRQLHGIRKVTFLNHRDCGAFNIWAQRKISDNPEEELRIHTDVLNRAAQAVRARHPDLLIEIKLMDLDGTVRTLPCQVCVPGGFRAEGYGPAARVIASSMQGSGLTLRPPSMPPAEPAGDANAFRELVRLRVSMGPLDTSSELTLLTEGITRYGLTADAARRVVDAEASRSGVTTGSQAEREVVIFLNAAADRQRRFSRQDVDQAAELYRRLAGPNLPVNQARRRVAAIAVAEGLSPRPVGILRTTTWFRELVS